MIRRPTSSKRPDTLFPYTTLFRSNQPSYSLLNGRISYLFEPLNVRLSVFGHNLTDEAYYINRFETDFATNSLYASPRTFGATLSWSFKPCRAPVAVRCDRVCRQGDVRHRSRCAIGCCFARGPCHPRFREHAGRRRPSGPARARQPH